MAYATVFGKKPAAMDEAIFPRALTVILDKAAIRATLGHSRLRDIIDAQRIATTAGYRGRKKAML